MNHVNVLLILKINKGLRKLEREEGREGGRDGGQKEGGRKGRRFDHRKIAPAKFS